MRVFDELSQLSRNGCAILALYQLRKSHVSDPMVGRAQTATQCRVVNTTLYQDAKGVAI
jgi:hypothetical protein